MLSLFSESHLLLLTCSVVEFFKELPHFLVKVGPIVQQMYGDEWEKRLQVCQISISSSVDILCNLYRSPKSLLIMLMLACLILGFYII